MISLRNITITLGGRTVLDNVDFTIAERGITLLQGPSGSGKTTLLNVIAGIIKPDSGAIFGLEGLRISYAFQDDRLLPWATALRNVMFVSNRNDAKKWLNRAGLGDSMYKTANQLSGGMRKRVGIARALAAESDLLLLDEPFNGLDTELKNRTIIPLINAYAETGPVVLVTHDNSDMVSNNIYH